MTDRELDLLVASAAPPLPPGLGDLPLDDAAPLVGRAATRRIPALPRRRRVPIAVALAAAAAGVAVVLVVGGRPGDGAGTAYAAPLVRAAESAPRLLLTGGWEIVRADQLGLDIGELEFARDEERVRLNWYPRRLRPIFAPDPAAQTVITPGERDGRPVQILRYTGSDRYRAAWRQGDWTLELDGTAPNPAGFREILASLVPVGVGEWLGAMPASVVRPSERADAVDALLADVPVPVGLDLQALRIGSGAVRDRYQLGAEVAGTIACGWIGQWVGARRSGDPAAARQAVAAMAGSHRWAVLREMDAAGDYPEVLWELADAMAAATPVLYGRPVSVADAYRDALGCRG